MGTVSTNRSKPIKSIYCLKIYILRTFKECFSKTVWGVYFSIHFITYNTSC